MELFNKNDYTVKTVELSVARSLVQKYHYSRGGSNTATFRHGLYLKTDPENCLGVAWWIPPTRTCAESVCGEEWKTCLSLTRLVIVPGMPTNSASFLLGRSIRIIQNDSRWKHLVTYADEGQGHRGQIYRATNWTYVGAMKGDPTYVDQDGMHVSRKAGPVTRTNQQMLDLGYRNVGRTKKHKFTITLRPKGRIRCL